MEEDRALLRRLVAEHEGLLADVKELRADVDELLRCSGGQHVPAGDRPRPRRQRGVQAGAAFEGVLQEQTLATRIYASAGQMAWSASRRASRKSRQHATAVRKEKILVAGGCQVHSPRHKHELQQSLEVLDVRSGKWEAARPMDAPLSGIGAAVLGGHLYVCGGLTLNSVKAVRYHPVTESRSSLPDLKVRRLLCAVPALGGYLYVLGGADGIDGSEVWNSVERLNPNSKDRGQFEWVLPGMCEHRLGHAAVALQHGIYVCGGSNEQLHRPGHGVVALEVARSAEFLSPASGKSVPLPKMAVPRAYHSACAVDGKIVVIGGGIPGKQRVVSAVEVYEPLAMCWTMSPAMGMPQARGSHVAVSAAGKLYVIGGGHADIPRSHAERSAQCLDLESLTWEKLPPMEFCRSAFCGVVLEMGPCALE